LEELQEEVSCTDFKCEQAAAGGESVSEFSVASFFCRDRRVPTKLREKQTRSDSAGSWVEIFFC
jgi:hypothetical protein